MDIKENNVERKFDAQFAENLMPSNTVTLRFFDASIAKVCISISIRNCHFFGLVN